MIISILPQSCPPSESAQSILHNNWHHCPSKPNARYVFHVTPRGTAAGGCRRDQGQEALGWQVRRAVVNTACTSRMERPTDVASPGTRGTRKVAGLQSSGKEPAEKGWKRGCQRGVNLTGILLAAEALRGREDDAKGQPESLLSTRGNDKVQRFPESRGPHYKRITKSWYLDTPHDHKLPGDMDKQLRVSKNPVPLLQLLPLHGHRRN